MTKSTRWRISLRALFALQIGICLFLVWWQTPFTITRSYSNRDYRKTTVRRGWDGVLYCHGRTTIFHDNGQKWLEYENYEGRYKTGCVNDFLMPDLHCWDREGREVPIEEVFKQMGISEYSPLRRR